MGDGLFLFVPQDIFSSNRIPFRGPFPGPGRGFLLFQRDISPVTGLYPLCGECNGTAGDKVLQVGR